MMPLAPGRFSMTKGCLSRSLSGSARMRAATSVGPPAGYETMMRTGFTGHACPQAAAGKRHSAKRMARRFMSDRPECGHQPAILEGAAKTDRRLHDIERHGAVLPERG